MSTATKPRLIVDYLLKYIVPILSAMCSKGTQCIAKMRAYCALYSIPCLVSDTKRFSRKAIAQARPVYQGDSTWTTLEQQLHTVPT
jgi:hypothetical protein